MFPSQNQQNVKFFAVCLTHLTKNEKNIKFEQGKGVWKGLTICRYMFLGMPIAMHNVRNWCDKYFLSYGGFSWFLTGRFRQRVLKQGVGQNEMQGGLLHRFHSILMVLTHPNRGIWGPKAVLHQASLTFGEPLGQADMQSDIPPWHMHLVAMSSTT